MQHSYTYLEASRRALVTYVYSIGIAAYIPGMIIWEAIWYTTRTSLARIDSTLNTHLVHFYILLPVVMSCLRDKPNAIFQHDNAKPYVACRVFTVLYSAGIRYRLGLQGLQIFHSLKLFGRGLMRNWVAALSYYG